MNKKSYVSPLLMPVALRPNARKALAEAMVGNRTFIVNAFLDTAKLAHEFEFEAGLVLQSSTKAEVQAHGA